MTEQPPEGDRPRARLTREDLGSWLSGPGSVAGFGRRILALVVDWLACLLVVRLFLPQIDYGTPGSSLVTLGFFLAELTLFTWLVSASFGQRLLGLAVLRLDTGGGPGLGRAFLRSLQICLVIPPVVWVRDGRGLHDRSVGTVVVRR